MKCQLPASSVWKSQCLHLDCNDVFYVRKPPKKACYSYCVSKGEFEVLSCVTGLLIKNNCEQLVEVPTAIKHIAVAHLFPNSMIY